jgi:uncharacterized protein (TIGR03435 family)
MVAAMTAVVPAQSRQAVLDTGVAPPMEGPNAFDVVSIKRSPAEPRFRVPKIQINPTAFYGTDTPVYRLVMEACGVRPYQILGIPEWVVEEKYDVQARTAVPVSPEKMRSLLGALLADRFKLRFHRETREMAGYNLVVGKGGPKLDIPGGADASGREVSTLDHRPGTLEMDLLASIVSNMLRTKVVNQTGLKGEYMFWFLPPGAPGIAPPDDGEGPLGNIQASLEVAGLRLVAAKVSVELIVVEHVERPQSQ